MPVYSLQQRLEVTNSGLASLDYARSDIFVFKAGLAADPSDQPVVAGSDPYNSGPAGFDLGTLPDAFPEYIGLDEGPVLGIGDQLLDM